MNPKPTRGAIVARQIRLEQHLRDLVAEAKRYQEADLARALEQVRGDWARQRQADRRRAKPPGPDNAGDT